MDTHRKLWNRGQHFLRLALSRSADHIKSMQLFLVQHAMVHSAGMSSSGLWSFEDDLWEGLTEEDIRFIPRNSAHSIAWNIWHIARIEDITMNLLIAARPQILSQANWLVRLGVAACDTGNAMDPNEIARFSMQVDIKALRAYRIAVGRRTGQTIKHLEPGELRQKVEFSRLQRAKDEGAVLDEADWLIRYWAGLNKAGLLLMPRTRHNFIHLNEAMRLKQKSHR